MAIIKFIAQYHPNKGGGRYTSLKNGINYILNDKKTSYGRYTGSQNCFKETALEEMIKTKEFYGKTNDDPRNRMGYHFSISWSPNENIDYETAMMVTKEFCEKYLSGYEVVFAVHTDQEHIHSHIIFNSVNAETGYKYQYKDGDWAREVVLILDKICRNHGLHTLEEDTGISVEEYEREQKLKRWCKRNGKQYKKSEWWRQDCNNKNYYNEKLETYSKNDFIRQQIDEAILESSDINELFEKLKESGFEIKNGCSKKYGEYFSVRGRGMERFRRNYVLGKNYSVEMIKRRISVKYESLPLFPPDKDYRYIVPFVYWRKYKVMTKVQRIYCMGLYNTGLRRKNQHLNYYEIRKNIKRIKELQEDIDFINKYHISDDVSATNAISELEDELKLKKENIRAFYQERRPYEQLLSNYRKMKKLQDAYEKYIDGNNEYENEYKQYMACKEVIAQYKCSESEIMDYEVSMKQEMKKRNREKREVIKKIQRVERIIDEINNPTKNLYEIDYDISDIEELNPIKDKKQKLKL